MSITLRDQEVIQLRRARGEKPKELPHGVASDKELKSHAMCAARLEDKSLCRGGRIQGRAFCYFHEPSLKKVREQSRAKGHEKSKERLLAIELNAPRLETLEDVRRLSVETIHQIRTGELGPKEGSVISAMIAHVLKTLPQDVNIDEDPADKLRRLLLEED